MYEDSNFADADRQDCQRVRAQAGLEKVRVLFPRSPAEFSAVGLDKRHFHYVISPGARVFHRRQFYDGSWEEALKQLVP